MPLLLIPWQCWVAVALVAGWYGHRIAAALLEALP